MYLEAPAEGRLFVYFDMPLSLLKGGFKIDLVVFSTTKQEVVILTGAYSAGDNNKVWKVNHSEGTWSVSKGAITERILNTFLAKVLKGYLTCSPSAENGYNAFQLMDTNIIPRADGNWNVQSDLGGEKGVKITDYAEIGTGDYATDRGTGVQVDAYDKYTALEAMYNSSGASVDTNVTPNEGNTTGVTVLILLLAITLFGGF